MKRAIQFLSLLLILLFSGYAMAFEDGLKLQTEVLVDQLCPPVAGGEDEYIEGVVFPRSDGQSGIYLMKICLLKSTIEFWYYTSYQCAEGFVAVENLEQNKITVCQRKD